MKMRGMVPPDPETDVSRARYAVVYLPGCNRRRFPASCVDVVESAQKAVAAADATQRRFPARVLGPSKSSEGQRMYYLVEWLK